MIQANILFLHKKANAAFVPWWLWQKLLFGVVSS